MREPTTNADTGEPIVLPAHRASVGALVQWLARHHRKLWWVVALELSAALFVGSTVSLPYYALAPGSATQVNELLRVPKDLDYPPKGEVLLTTVSLSRVHLLGAIQGWFDPNIDIVPEKEILGPTPPKNFQQQNLQEMDDSILFAEVVALRKLGYPITEHGDGALVAAVASKAPADGHLTPGDVVTQINDKHVELASDLVSALATMKFGDAVRLTVTAPNSTTARTETIKLGGTNAEKTVCSTSDAQTGKGCLGVTLGTKSHRFDEPVKLTIDAHGIGGPSAGLAFTLAIIDELRPGELTGGQKVAVTGTIDLNGRVGDVGGVVQKTAAVRAAGAKYFLVPPGEYNEAKAHAGKHLTVIKVATLDEALQALGKLGGDVADIGPAPTTTTTVARRTRR